MRLLKLLGSNPFFSNRILDSFSLRSLNRMRVSPLVTSPTKYLKSNTQLLQSSFISMPKVSLAKPPSPFHTYFSRNYSWRGSSRTWNRYNKHYNRGRFSELKGPLIFTVLFCAATTFAAPYVFNFTPLAAFKSNPSAFVYTLIGINAAICLAWRAPQFRKILNRYFLLTKDQMGSKWSMLGSAFSHQDFMHLAVNMFVLQSFGTSLCAIVGVSNFAIMYLNSAVISSFVSLALPKLMGASLASASLGASGAIFSVFGTFAYLIPKAPIGLFFIPIPGGAWVAFLGSMALNVAGVALRWGTYDYAAHLGGCFAAIWYGWYFVKKREKVVKRRVSYGF